MSDRAYAKVQVQQKTLSGSSPKSSLLQRTCACGQHTLAGAECSTCRSAQSTLLRAHRAFEPPSAPGAVPGSAPAQEHGPSFNAAFDRASRFAHDFSQIPVYSAQPAALQTKLTVNQPGDVYEQEADQVAEQVMRMVNPASPEVTNENKAHNTLMRKQSREPGVDRATAIPGIPPVVHAVLNRGGGQPLDTATRAFMKPRFGHDFSRVRIHADERAAESAQSINALAYTVGNDIVFGAGQYAPMTAMGQRLLAHELTHTIQQSTHGLAVQCQGAPPASTPTPAPAPELTLPPSTIADFCRPFASRSEARQARTYLLQKFIPLDKGIFGPEVGGLWESYLNRKHGDSLARHVFSSPSSSIFQGFARSITTQNRQKELVDKILAALPTSCPTLPANTPTDIPVSRYLSKEDLEFPIDFDKPLEIPGHIAGDVGSSDAGPDLRRVSGTVTLRRDTDASGKTTGIRLMTNFQFLVQDAIDFCPGNPGAGFEQALTIPLSRLEATGLFLQDEPFAYDVPFEVRYSGISIEMDLDLALVKRCFPDATGKAEPEPVPTPKPTPKPPPDRFFERD